MQQNLDDIILSTNTTKMNDATLEPFPTTASTELSDDQEIVLIVLLICAATLSLIGSCTIVFKILRGLSRNQTTTPYDRIILGLSSCDIIASITYATGPFFLPRETSLRVWSFGSPETCQALGFFNQFSCIGAMYYNFILSFYYLLTVRFGVKRKEFRRKYELWMHLSALFFPISAIIGYLGQWYAEQDLFMSCWAKEAVIGYILGGVPIAVTFLTLIINNIVIYAYVRKTLNSNIESPESSTGPTITLVQKQLKNEAATQGFLYVGSFFVTVTPLFTIQVLGGALGYTKEDQGEIYPLLVLNSMVLPLQGFFNVYVYLRPMYTRFRAVNPDKSICHILQQALFDPKIPKLSSTNAGETSNPTPNVITRQPVARRKSGRDFVSNLVDITEGDLEVAIEADGGTMKINFEEEAKDEENVQDSIP